MFSNQPDSGNSSFSQCIPSFNSTYAHLNAEFQRRAKRDKKVLLSDQCKEIKENNRMGKTRELFKKIRDTIFYIFLCTDTVTLNTDQMGSFLIDAQISCILNCDAVYPSTFSSV